MSTITEPRARRAARAVLRFGRQCALALLLWWVLLTALARWLEPTDVVLAIVPADRVAAVLSHAPVRLLDAPAGVLRLRGDASGYVAAVYAQGATWVIPAASGGCRARGVLPRAGARIVPVASR